MASQHHSHQLRAGRYSESGQIYLLTVVVLHREPVFSSFEAGRIVVDAFKKAQQEQFANSLAFVVMPDHFHWLIELQNIGLSKLIGRTKSRSTVALNRALGRVGPRCLLAAATSYDPANTFSAALRSATGSAPRFSAAA